MSAQPRTTFSALLRAARPLAHANLAPPLLYGQAIAFATTGRFSWSALAVAQLFGVVDHLLIVFANDYADREADRLHDAPTPFSGGSRVLVDGDLAPATVRSLAIGAACALVVLGLAAALLHPAMPLLAIVAIALIGAYSYPPLRLSYRGGGELLQGLGVGVVLPLVGLFAQGGALTPEVLRLLAPTFVLGVAGNVLTSLPDEAADRAAQKGSPAARWGGVAARGASIALHASAVVAMALALPAAPAPRLGLAALALAPQVASLFARDPRSRRATLAFVVLGGATESFAILGASAALALAR
ncbi:MAG: prenyltransferase [Sandaracinus sp.]